MVTIALILVSVCFPRSIKASPLDSMKQGFAELIYDAEWGIIKVINNIFCDSKHEITEKNKEGERSQALVYLTPETIIKGHFLLMDANIFQNYQTESKDKSYYYDAGSFNEQTGDASQNEGGKTAASETVGEGKEELQQVIRGWYYALRNFAIVALLSVLVYLGIRMMMTSISQDKAKYKMMIKDWLVAICLVTLMHFIMVGILGLADMITSAVGRTGENANITQQLMNDIETALNDSDKDKDEKAEGRREAVGKELVLAAAIFLTISFAIKYVLRMITIIFLTLLAPITAITYPIDKVSDGKAQAFNFWFREFFYNVMIQPFHLLIYVVLLGSATTLAKTNVLYAILCYAMMFPAERLIREMFGFRNKLGAPLGAMATAAGVGSLVKSMSRLREGGSGSGKGGNSGGSNGGNEAPPPIKDKTEGNLTDYDDGIDALPGDGESNSEDNSPPENTEQPGGDASAADAYQNSQDPVAEMKRAGLEEQLADGQLDESDLTDEQRALLGMDNEEQQVDNGAQADEAGEEAQPEVNGNEDTEQLAGPNAGNKVSGQLWRARAANHEKRLLSKYGTANSMGKDLLRGGRAAKDGWKNNKGLRKITGAVGGFLKNSKLLDPNHKTVAGQRFKRVAGRIGKTALRTGMIGAGALAGATLATVTGDPKKIITAASAGAALGNTGARTITGVAGRVADSAKSYYTTGYDAVKGQDGRKERAKQAYINNQQERDYAAQRLYEKSGGTVASRDEIDEEMEKRYRIRENGITDNGQIDAILDQSEGKYEAGMEEAKNSDSRIAEVADKLDNKNKQQYDSKYKKHYDELTQQQESINNNQSLSDAEKEERLQKAREKFDNEYGSGAAEKALAHHDVETQVKERSIKQSLNAHKIASQYSESAFRDEKKMTALRESSVNEYRESMKQQGREVSVEHATDIVVQAMSDAAEIKGVKGAAITNPYRQNTANNRRNTRNNTNNNNNTSNQNLPQNSNEPSN